MIHRQWFPQNWVRAGERGFVKVKEQGLPGTISVPSQNPGQFSVWWSVVVFCNSLHLL